MDSEIKVKTTNQPTAETKGLWLLRKMGFTCLQELDWVGKDNAGKWTVIEVKGKELFKPGSNFPKWGAGLNRSQLWLRKQLLDELGLRTYLLVFAKGTNNIYGCYLDELERKGGYFDTPNRIRIYPLDSFTNLNAGHLIESPVVQKQGGKNGF